MPLPPITAWPGIAFPRCLSRSWTCKPDRHPLILTVTAASSAARARTLW